MRVVINYGVSCERAVPCTTLEPNICVSEPEQHYYWKGPVHTSSVTTKVDADLIHCIKLLLRDQEGREQVRRSVTLFIYIGKVGLDPFPHNCSIPTPSCVSTLSCNDLESWDILLRLSNSISNYILCTPTKQATNQPAMRTRISHPSSVVISL